MARHRWVSRFSHLMTFPLFSSLKSPPSLSCLHIIYTYVLFNIRYTSTLMLLFSPPWHHRHRECLYAIMKVAASSLLQLEILENNERYIECVRAHNFAYLLCNWIVTSQNIANILLHNAPWMSRLTPEHASKWKRHREKKAPIVGTERQQQYTTCVRNSPCLTLAVHGKTWRIPHRISHAQHENCEVRFIRMGMP